MMPNNLSAKIKEIDINDVFEDILFSEERVVEENYKQGFAIGSSEDSVEGYHLGYHRGAEIGSELGYYKAFAEYHLGDNQKCKIPDKIVKNIETLQEGCMEFPRSNSEDVDIFESIEKLRVIYKKICIQLKIKTYFRKEGINF